MTDMLCPYCEAKQEVNHDDGFGYSEDYAHQHECTECEKLFVFHTVITFSYHPQKADCLNGEDHEWRFNFVYPMNRTKMECFCGEERAPTPSEWTDIKSYHATIQEKVDQSKPEPT